MIIDYKKFLPSSIRVGRWGEFIEAFQNLIDSEIIPNNIEILKTSKQIETMSYEDIKKACLYFGRELTTYDGYTSTLDYGRRFLRTIVFNILKRTTRDAYLTILNNYNQYGEIYPIYGKAGNLKVAVDWWQDDEQAKADLTLDMQDNWSLDSKLEKFSNLDKTSSVDEITRHIIIKYAPIFCEYKDNTIFMNDFTLSNFYKDMMENKRKTEVLYFEPCILANASSDMTTTSRVFSDYKGESLVSQKSALIQGDLSNIVKVTLGSSSHSILGYGIQDVKEKRREITDLEIIQNSATKFEARKKVELNCKLLGINLEETLALQTDNLDEGWTLDPQEILDYTQLFDITEVALHNNVGQCVFYTTFPKIQFLEKMNANISFSISII